MKIKAFKNLRKAKKITQEKMAEILGVSRSTVSMWEINQSEPDNDMLKTIADYFNVSVDYLLGHDIGSAPKEPYAKRIPLLGRIPAGIPIEAIEEILDWEEIPDEWTKGGRKYFALKIKGNSMYPKYLEDDVIIVECQETAETGQDAVVMVNGFDATFKKISINENGIMLRPINPEYEPVFYTSQQVIELPVQILGICREIRRKV